MSNTYQQHTAVLYMVNPPGPCEQIGISPPFGHSNTCFLSSIILRPSLETSHSDNEGEVTSLQYLWTAYWWRHLCKLIQDDAHNTKTTQARDEQFAIILKCSAELYSQMPHVFHNQPELAFLQLPAPLFDLKYQLLQEMKGTLTMLSLIHLCHFLQE